MSTEAKLFDIESLFSSSFRMAIIAPSESGKTYYLLYLLSILVKEYKWIFLITPNKNDLYNDYIWPNHIRYASKVEEIDNEIDSIMKFGNELKDKYMSSKKVLIILDDLGFSTSGKKSSVGDLLTRGRNCGISCIILMQSYQMIFKTFCMNFTHTALFKFNDDLDNYLGSVQLQDSKSKTLVKIDKLLIMLSKMYPKTKPLVMLVHCKKQMYTHSAIPNDINIKKIKILHFQHSSMKNNKIDNDSLFV